AWNSAPMSTPCRSRYLNLSLVMLGALLLRPTRAPGADDFRITSISVSNNDVQIGWKAPAGSNYVVQSVTPLRASGSNNFADVSPAIAVAGVESQPTNYTHRGGLTNSGSRFYRVRSFPIPPRLQIEPTNAIIGRTMSSLYTVLLVNPDNTMANVT